MRPELVVGRCPARLGLFAAIRAEQPQRRSCRFRVAVTVNTVIMLCQLGGITITALKVFSDLQQPEGAATPRLRRDAAFAVASCASTLTSFCANVFGMRGVFDTLRAAAVSVRASVASAVHRRSAVAPVDDSDAPPPPGSCGQPSQVAHLPDSTVQVEVE